ncbi:MAG: hypothetical protein ACI854_002732, partial [Arenicella sp.]
MLNVSALNLEYAVIKKRPLESGLFRFCLADKRPCYRASLICKLSKS